MQSSRGNLLYLAIVFALGAFINLYCFLTFDVIWLVECANHLLHGGRYYYTFFETNPPLILYLYSPIIFLQSILHGSMRFAAGFYVLACIATSLWASNAILRKAAVDQALRRHFCFAMFFLFWVFSGISYAERDYFALLLCLPYFSAMVLQLNNKRLGFSGLVAVGFLAGIGIALKPYFLLVLIFSELYLMTRKRSIWAGFRIETGIITLTIFTYLYLVAWLTPEYFSIILPLTFQLYIGHFHYSSVWDLMASMPSAFFLLASAVIIGMQIRSKRNDLINILFLAALGFYGSFLLQGQVTSYHIFPSLTLAFTIIVMYSEPLLSRVFSEKSARTISAYMTIYILLVVVLLLFMVFAHYFRPRIYASMNSKAPYKILVKTVDELAGSQSVMSIAPWFNIYAVQQASHFSLNQRMPAMFFVPGIEDLRLSGQLEKYHAVKNAFIQYELDDLQRYNPKVIVMSRLGFNYTENNKPVNQSYLEFFESNAKFKQFFKSYHLVRKLKMYYLYTRDDHVT